MKLKALLQGGFLVFRRGMCGGTKQVYGAAASEREPAIKKITPRKTEGYLSGLLTHFFNNPKSLTCFERSALLHITNLLIARFCHSLPPRVWVKG